MSAIMGQAGGASTCPDRDSTSADKPGLLNVAEQGASAAAEALREYIGRAPRREAARLAGALVAIELAREELRRHGRNERPAT